MWSVEDANRSSRWHELIDIRRSGQNQAALDGAEVGVGKNGRTYITLDRHHYRPQHLRTVDQHVLRRVRSLSPLVALAVVLSIIFVAWRWIL